MSELEGAARGLFEAKGLRADYRRQPAEDVDDLVQHGRHDRLDHMRRDLVGHECAHHRVVERVELGLAVSVHGRFLGIV